ncbi:DUF6438 domain-containing protein [Hymenobacter sp. ASUV-10]|uniref:DUF6438 domain-containing protein n=1 Tax=Hymenobacter aranciens TaxID=3063996 RepID=A0ABT9BIJ3_9BACT|nr:DUF6438 domain-containing protein [Hymenobacter sp. ASUV-10]MDO7877493.1 DUF6438 domain-containing protein [Hymenobacter sp. ASUV-10]
MKSLYAFLALACVGALPACTVHRHYYGPGYEQGGVREYHTTDTVYVNTGSTTIINQSGTVGGPRGGYVTTGPGRTTPPPPPPRNYPPAGSYPPPRTNPPPRNTGGVRTPPAGPTRQPTAGTNPPPAGPGRQPTSGSGTTPSPGTQPPTSGQPGNLSQSPITGPVRTPGGTTPPAGSGSPVTSTPGTISGNGGIKTGNGSTSGGGTVSPGGTIGGNGGIKTGNGSTPTGAPGSLSGSVTTGTPGTISGNGGIKTGNGGTISGNGGIKTGNGSTPTGQTPQQYPTGGIKPIPNTPSQPTASLPVSSETGVTGPATNGGIRTGGIKPSRDTQPVTAGEDSAPADYSTGGIKPIPTTTTPNSTPATTPADNIVRGPGRTGGIKPARGRELTAAGEAPIAADGSLSTGGEATATPAPAPAPGGTLSGSNPVKTATPALMFAKMPCRGTCPSYTATIWPDGRVVYVGQQNVAHLGTYELKLEPAKVEAIQQQAKQANFNGLAASYTNGATDIPATVLTMYGAGGSAKTVTVEDSAPAEVQALFDYVNGTINQLVAGSQFNEQRAPRRGR